MPGWYAQNGIWQRRKAITIKETAIDADLTNFPVIHRVVDDSDLLTYAQSDGKDVVFTNSDGLTKLSHQVVEFNQILQRDAVWSWHNKPEAIHYVGTQDRTYVGWINQAGEIRVGQYDHNTKAWTVSPTLATKAADDHNNPTMTILADGRLMVFYSDHAGPDAHYRKSANPEDISSWQTAVPLTLDTQYTYVRPLKMGSRMYLIWRGPESSGRDVKMAWTDNEGTSWSSVVTVFENVGQRPYVHASVDETASRIYFAANEGNLDETTSSDIFAFYMWNDAGTNRWYKSDGTLIGTDAALPITPATATQVYDSTGAGNEGQLFNIHHGFGNPVILWGKYISDYSQTLHYSRWTGSAWTNVQIADMGETVSNPRSQGHYTGNAHLDTIDPRTVYYSKADSDFHHIFEAYTPDNGTTWISKKISQGNSKNFRPVVPANRHATELNVLWLHGNYYAYAGGYQTSLQCYPFAGSHLDAVFVVKASISASVDTVIYLYYGNKNAADQQDAANVFDANTILVKVGDTTYKSLGLLNISGLAGLTIEVGFSYNNSVNTVEEYLVSNFQASGQAGMFLVRKAINSNDIFASVRSNTGSSVTATFTDIDVNQNTYNGLAVVYDSPLGNLHAYYNGTLSSITAATPNAIQTPASANEVYSGASPHDLLDGIAGYVDWLAISNLARSNAWMKARTINLGLPSSFSTIGSTEDVLPYLQQTINQPNKVTNLTAVGSSGQVTLTWTNPTATILGGPVSLTDKIVQYRALGSQTWDTWVHAADPTPSAIVTDITNGTTYEFRVAAINGQGTGEYEFITATPFDASALRKQALQGWS